MAPPVSRADVPHFALLFSAGMGHLNPFLRLAATLASRGCAVTFICPTPLVSAAEADHIAAFVSSSPFFHLLEFPLLPFDLSSANSDNPLFLQFERIRQAAHLLGPILSSVSPPLSALIVDEFLTSAFVPVARGISLPIFIMFTSSAAMLSFYVSYPRIAACGPEAIVKIPGLTEDLPTSAFPQPLRDPKSLFSVQFSDNWKTMVDADGIIVNTWEALESATLAALNAGEVVSDLPQVIPVGPLLHYGNSAEAPAVSWLDDQPVSSVVYVSFGSWIALPPEQIRELGAGLESSGCRFLWILKTKKVDKEGEDDRNAMEELLGEGFLERVEGRGKVVKGWLDQQAVLNHPAVGGFLSHCGWNSVTEAALRGVRMLAWPRLGDQRVNAMVVEKSGLGQWPSQWSWEGDDDIVRGEEIGWRLKALMDGATAAATKVKMEALSAAGDGGSSRPHLDGLVARFQRGNR